MAFCLHLRLLMWKNFTIRRRQKIRCVIDIVWPLTLFIMLVTLRFVGNKENVHECHFEARPMPSAGMLAFLRGALCTLNNTCHATSQSVDNNRGKKQAGSRAQLVGVLQRAQLLADTGQVPRLWEELRDASHELAALADDLRSLPAHAVPPLNAMASPSSPSPSLPPPSPSPPPPLTSSHPPSAVPKTSSQRVRKRKRHDNVGLVSTSGEGTSTLHHSTLSSPSALSVASLPPPSLSPTLPPPASSSVPAPPPPPQQLPPLEQLPQALPDLGSANLGVSALEALLSHMRLANALANNSEDYHDDKKLETDASNPVDVEENEIQVDEPSSKVLALLPGVGGGLGAGGEQSATHSRWAALARHVADASRLLRDKRQRAGLNRVLEQLVERQARAAERVKERLRVSDGVAQLLAAQRLVCGHDADADGDQDDLPPLARLALLAEPDSKQEEVPTDFSPDPDCSEACNQHFRSLESNPATRLLWHWLKPFVRGRILYSPDTPSTRRVMAHVDAFFDAFERVRKLAQHWATHVLPQVQRRFDALNVSMKGLDTTPSQRILNSTKEGRDLQDSIKWLQLLRSSYSDATKWLNMLNEVLDCFLAHKTHPMASEEEAVVEGLHLLRKGRLWAVVAFDKDAKPPFITYKIRVNSRNMDDTNFVRSILHYPGPRSHPFFDLKYFTSGFIYIQDLVERGIVAEVLAEEHRAVRAAMTSTGVGGEGWEGEAETSSSSNASSSTTTASTTTSSYSSSTTTTSRPLPKDDDPCKSSGANGGRDVDAAAATSSPFPQDLQPGFVLQQFPYPCHIYDKFSFAVSRTFPLLMVLSWVYGCASLVKAAVAEKETRLAEAQRAAGVADGALWLAWLLEGFLTGAISAAILTALLVLGHVLERSSVTLIFALLLTYCLAAAAFACLLATFFSRASVAAGVGGMVFVLSYLPYATLDLWSNQAPNALKYSAGVLCNVAFGFGCLYLSAFEQLGVGATWTQAARSPFDGDSYSLLACMATLLADAALYMLLAWYISNVWPGRYGVPKPIYFPFTRSFWCGVDESTLTRHEEAGDESADEGEPSKSKGESTSWSGSPGAAAGPSGMGAPPDKEGATWHWGMGPPVLEAPPANLLPGIRLRRLTKVFPGGRVAVDHLSLTFYEGHITAFLGHNGAGKTTVISMLTGLLPPTSGTAFIRGLDIRRHMPDIRRSLGVCPQHNVLYDNLTASEHLWLAARVRGQSAAKLRQEVPAMLRELGLVAKAKALAGRLSGGARRKLCVATAFVGNSRTVILDEPTAGVDPASRRAIWRLLERARRQGRTLLLCTHHLDEAERLGDRVAVLACGRLLCAGSPLFLRRVLGLGYRVTLDVTPSTSPADAPAARSQDDAIPVDVSHDHKDSGTDASADHKTQPLSAAQVDWLVSLVRSHAGDGVRVLQQRGTELLLALPAEARSHFPALFADLLEAQRQGALRSFGVRDSSLEEIFLRLPQGVRSPRGGSAGGGGGGGGGKGGVTSPARGDIESLGYPEPPVRRETCVEHAMRFICCSRNTKRIAMENEEVFQQGSKTSVLYYDSGPSGVEESARQSPVRSNHVVSARVVLRQLRALLTKRIHHTRRSLRVLFSELVVPPLFVTATLAMTQLLPRPGPAPPLALVPWLYHAPRSTFFDQPLLPPLPLTSAAPNMSSQLPPTASTLSMSPPSSRSRRRRRNVTNTPATTPTTRTPFSTAEALDNVTASPPSSSTSPSSLFLSSSISPPPSQHPIPTASASPASAASAPPLLPRRTTAVRRRMREYAEALLGNPGMGTRCVLKADGKSRDAGCVPLFRSGGFLLHTQPLTEPLPPCRCISGAPDCASPTAAPLPAAAVVSTGDLIVNLTGRDVDQWLVRTTNLQEERTYGGFSFGARPPLDSLDWTVGEVLNSVLAMGTDDDDDDQEPLPTRDATLCDTAPPPASVTKTTVTTVTTRTTKTTAPPPYVAAEAPPQAQNTSNTMNFITVWFNNKGWTTSAAYLNAANNVVLRILLREVREAATRGAALASSFEEVEEEARDEDADEDASVAATAATTRGRGRRSADARLPESHFGILAINHPMNNTDEQLRDPQHFILLSNINVVHALAVLLAMSFVPASFLVLLVEERASRAKHLQLLCGAGRVVYWVAELIWGLSCYVLAASLCLLVFVAFGEEAYVSHHTLPLFLALLMLYGWASVPMMFPASFVFREPSTAFVLMACLNLAIGMLTSITVVLLQIFAAERLAPLQEQLRSAFLVFPQFCLCQGLVDLVTAHYMAHARAAIVGGSTAPAVEADVSRNLWYLAGDGIAFFLLTLAIELWPRFLRPRRLRRSLRKQDCKPFAKDSLDADVASERERVHALTPAEARAHALLLKDLSKEYRGGPLALDALCLGVHPGEVFGLLGLNGAGKTTTFKLLTGEARTNRGDALVAGASVVRQRAQALRRCGYCPQADALHAQLSVREHLRLYAALRGLSSAAAKQAVRESLTRLQLWRCRDQPAGTLSGGTRRKLSSALALLGEPPVLLLDEPTAGMDASARAALGACVRAAASRGAGALLTSHVLAECEALCARLAVLAAGRLRCLGSAHHLKSRFGRGYLVELRAPEGAGAALAALAAQLPGASPLTSRSRAQGLGGCGVWYGRSGSSARSSGSSPRYGSGGSAGARVRERVSAHARLELPHAGARHLAALFSALEAARAAGALHDYSVSQATLEEVFLRFAYEAAGEELADSPDAAPAGVDEDSEDGDEDEVEVLIMSEDRDGEFEL